MATANATHEKQRLEYFKKCKAECEKKLEWYQSREAARVWAESMVRSQCDLIRQKISFYDDAIKAFGGKKHA